MKVAFDAVCLGDGPITGVARSFLNGLEAYAAEWASDMIVFVPDGCDKPELPQVHFETTPRGAWARQRELPKLLRALGAAVLHSSVASVPLRAPCPTIATVHDLPWLHPESGERSTWWRRFATMRSLRSATAVIAPSQFTLEAAAQILGGRDKLHHIPHSTDVPQSIGNASQRTGPFVVLGDNRPRKNRERVQQAHRLAKAQRSELPDLRFVGPPNSYIGEREKAELLQTCRAIAQCSLYEGFGMPVLEALAHGAPLICSDIPPHREIAGDAATYVDPTSIESIVRGFMTVPLAGVQRLPPPVASAWRALHERVH